MSDTYDSEFGLSFQQHILSVMCLIPGFCLRYRTALDHTFFIDDHHRVIARAVLDCVDRDKSVPTLATLTEYTRDLAGKDDMPQVAETLSRLFKADVRDVEAVARKVVAFGKQQALVNATLKAAEMLDKGDRNIRPLFDKAQLVGEDLLNVGVDYCNEVSHRAHWYTEPEVLADTVRTGLAHLDYALEGGLGRGELGVVLAPPNRGKTSVLINIGFGALSDVRGLNVAHYSLEMPKRRVTMRYDDRLMGNRVRYKKTEAAQYVQELAKRVKLLNGRLFIQSYPTRSAGVSTIRAHLALLAAQGFKPDVVIVDYADIMKPERRMGEMRHEQAGIYEDLRQLAGEFNCAVWTGSQASKSALEKDTITIGDFAEAFEKAHIVDVAAALCQTMDERIDGRARLFLAKVRNAEDGRTVECDYRRDCCLLRSTAVLDLAGTKLGETTGENDEEAQKVVPTEKVYSHDPKRLEAELRRDVDLAGHRPVAKKKYVTKPAAAVRKIGGAPAKGPVKRRLKDIPRRELHLTG